MHSDEQPGGASSQRHAAVLASALDAIITIDHRGVILEFNPSAAQIFGWAQDEAVGARLSELIIPHRYREAHERGMRQYAQTGEGPVLGTRIEIEALHRNGREFPIELTITPITTGQGTVFTAFIRDLTQAKALNRELSVASFTIEQSSDAIFYIDEHARIIACNPAAAASLGYSREGLVGRTILEIDRHMTPDLWRRHWEELRESGSVQLESDHVRADGSVFPVEVSANFINHEGAEFNCAYARDITLRKEAQRRVYESSQRFELVLGAAELGFWDWNIRTGEKVVNDEYLRLCGATREQFAPDQDWFRSRVHPDDLEASYQSMVDHFEGRTDRIDSQYRLRRADAGWRWVHDRGSVVERDEQGRPLRAMGAMQDVTQRREATEALRVSEQRFRDIASSVGEFIWEADDLLRLVYVSDAFSLVTGIESRRAVGVSLAELTTSEGAGRMTEIFRASRASDEPVRGLQIPVMSAAGGVAWIRINAQPIYSEDQRHIGYRGTGLDITAERAAEEARTRSEELQQLSRSIVMNLLEPGDLSETIDRIVQRLGQFLGAQRAYLLRFDKELLSVVSSSSWFTPALTEPHRRFPLREARVSTSSMAHIQPNRPVCLEAGRDEMPTWMHSDTRAHLGLPVPIAGRAASYLGIDWTGPGGGVRDVDLTVLMSVVSSLGHTIERRITKRELELSAMRLASEARRAEQASEAKSVFLAQMSHELRTPLTAVLGSSEILAAGGSSPERQRRLLESILTNGRSLLAQINSVLDLSRYEHGQTPVRDEPARLLSLVEQVRSRVMPIAMLHDVRVEFEASSSLPAQIVCDAFQLTQVLVNLITNSIKYSGTDGVRVLLGTDESSPDELVMQVIDQGRGIQPDHIDRLFQPFERGRDAPVPGTGLGLSICKRIAQALGGRISCTSTPGVETRFAFAIPLRAYGEGTLEAGVIEEANPEMPTQTPDAQQLRGVRVLLAEDSPQVREVLEFFLSDRGASIESVENGAEAIEAVRDRGEAFDVILMDMQMPVMDGYEAAAALKAMGAGTPIIALTAHGLAEDREKCLSCGCDDYLSKPVSPDLLSVAIRRAIGMGTSGTDAPAPGRRASGQRMQPPDDLVSRYREHLRTQLDQLTLGADDRAALRRLLHQIKGTSATLGLDAISASAAQAESALKDGADDERLHAKLLRLHEQILA